MCSNQKVLFVDDEKNILNGLRRMLRPLRSDWDMTFADDPRKALDLMDESEFDVIVSDMRMPGMSGAELLEQVKNIHPEMVRIILSGQSSKATIMRSIGPMHQYLAKPCHPETLKNVLQRSCDLRSLLSEKRLLNIVSQIESLPCLPELYAEILEELQKPEPSLKEIGRIISKDIGMCSKILQLVNSAMFGVRKHIVDPEQAVTLLGVDTVRMLVLTIKVFSQLKKEEIECLSIESLWEHSFAVGAFAKKIAEIERVDQEIIDDSFMGGLLHDLGKLVLAHKFTDKYASVLEFAVAEDIELAKLEHEMVGASHAELGAYIMGIWGMIDPIVESLAFHHHPIQHKGKEFNAVTAVHVANALELKLSDRQTAGPPSQVDIDYLTNLGLEDRLPRWEEACHEILEEAGTA